jgi:hypothetical protein
LVIPSIFYIIIAIGIAVSLLFLITAVSEIINPLSWGILIAAFIVGIATVFSNCRGRIFKLFKLRNKKGGK